MTTLYLQALSATSIAYSLQISEPFLVIAGYTGRNAYAVNQHMIELQAHGITPPEMIPMFWTLPNWLPQNESLETSSKGLKRYTAIRYTE